MKQGQKKNYIRLIIILVILAGVFFDQYMKHTWDHEIVGREYSKYLVSYTNGNTSTADVKNLEGLPNIFDSKLNIIKQNDKYIWGDHILYKSVVSYRKHPNWTGPSYVVEDTIFENIDKSVSIRVASGGYISYRCQPFGMKQNAIVTYKIDEDRSLVTYTNVDVYDNFLVSVFCGRN
ncbi:MAG: hypothetical protein HRT94_03620 [Alphaproteobacteria bacterium]|nr:hypothetical protein [Alphaproteobacteria bacterium]